MRAREHLLTSMYRGRRREGLRYYFRSREKAEAEIAGGGFLEYAEVHGNLYATSRRSWLRR
jgi:guanylate kinase